MWCLCKLDKMTRKMLIFFFFFSITILIDFVVAGAKCRTPKYIICKNDQQLIGRLCVRQCSKNGICAPCQFETDEYEGPKGVEYYTELCKKHYPSSLTFLNPVSQCFSAVD